MLVFPQLATGSLAQFPIRRMLQTRTLVHTAPDGSVVKLADLGAGSVQWQLRYDGLTDGDLAALEQFFATAEGSLNSFTFVDPNANLVAWSDDLSNAVWSAAPLLTLTGGKDDPADGSNAWFLRNTGQAAQGLTQTIHAPGQYVYCVSVYAKADSGSACALLLGNQRFSFTASSNWQRFACTGTGDPDAESMTFGIELGASSSVEIYGMQVEPQASPSAYKMSTTGGCYENARLREDTFSFTSAGVNRHSATLHIFYADHL